MDTRVNRQSKKTTRPRQARAGVNGRADGVHGGVIEWKSLFDAPPAPLKPGRPDGEVKP